MTTMMVLRGCVNLIIFALLASACSGQTVSTPTPVIPADTPAIPTAPSIPLEIKPLDPILPRNLFQEYLGKTDTEVQGKIEAAWQQFFDGSDETGRIYYPVGEDMAYIEDIGNGDVRTEGMSYGMMIAVQLDKKAEFDRIWKWAKTYMYQTDGPFRGYFAWHCSMDGKKLDTVTASDGEEWFVMALFFASTRWGDGEASSITAGRLRPSSMPC